MAFVSMDWWWSVQIYIYCIYILTLGLYAEYGRFEFERRYICNVDCKLVGEVTMEVIVVTIKFLWFCWLSLAICSAKPLPSYSHIIVQLKAKHLNLHSCYGKQSFLPNLEVYSIASYISYIAAYLYAHAFMCTKHTSTYTYVYIHVFITVHLLTGSQYCWNIWNTLLSFCLAVQYIWQTSWHLLGEGQVYSCSVIENITTALFYFCIF